MDNEIREYLELCKRGGPLVSLVVSLSSTDLKESLAALERVYKMIRYHADKCDDLISFIIGLSCRDIRRNKIVPFHLHGVIKTVNEDFAEGIMRRINKQAARKNKRLGIKQRGIPAKIKTIESKRKNFDNAGADFIPYLLNQCGYKMQYSNGDDEDIFDFRNFKNITP